MARAMRNNFKQVRVQNISYLYPMPVMKDKKYLVRIDEKYVDFFIFALKHSFLKSFDQDPRFMAEISLHSDGKTKIFEIQYSNLSFHFLKNREHDLAKSKVIEELLLNKVIACLNDEESAIDKLRKCYENQMKCSTCKELGIENTELKKLLGLLE